MNLKYSNLNIKKIIKIYWLKKFNPKINTNYLRLKVIKFTIK